MLWLGNNITIDLHFTKLWQCVLLINVCIILMSLTYKLQSTYKFNLITKTLNKVQSLQVQANTLFTASILQIPHMFLSRDQ